MRDNTATYQRFQEIIAEPGCPVCGLSLHAVRVYLDTLLWESSTDVNLSAMMAASLGFCGRHSRQLLSFGGQRLAAAVVERLSLLAAMRRLPELASASPAPRRSRLDQLLGRPPALPPFVDLSTVVDPCPACVRQQTEETRGVDVLLKHLDEFAGPLRRAGGLCLPHFIQTTRAADDPARTTLLAIQQQVWASLAGDLETFIRQHIEHHHTEPISDPARMAVERTIAGLTGDIPAR